MPIADSVLALTERAIAIAIAIVLHIAIAPVD
jgi:hypothetical protein